LTSQILKLHKVLGFASVRVWGWWLIVVILKKVKEQKAHNLN